MDILSVFIVKSVGVVLEDDEVKRIVDWLIYSEGVKFLVSVFSMFF